MKKAALILSLFLAFALLGSAAWASDMQQSGPPMGQGGPGGGMRGGAGGGMMSATDPEIQAVLDENADKFEQFVFDDPVTGISLEYSLYIPEGYDGSAAYPLLMFIPDSTGAGKTARQIVEQYYGAAVWVTDEEQAKHASFVLVPAFSETVVNDDWSVSEQVETAVNLIAQLQQDYSIDANRLYTTGQSMGCMTSLYLNSKYPDLFAASMFVSGQWDITVLKPLEEKTFFYITLPMLAPVLKVVLMLAITGAFKDYEAIMVLTNGGPGSSTNVMFLYIYNLIFGTGSNAARQIGYGALLSLVAAVIVGAVTIVYNIVAKKLDDVV